jgi:hypothetical protein
VVLLVWNAQGATSSAGGENAKKWEALWANGLQPIVGAAAKQTDNVMALLCESGWAPWVALNAQVTVNRVYPASSASTTYDKDLVATSPLCSAVGKQRRWSAWWIPWVKTLNGMRQNSRCSFGAFYAPSPSPAASWPRMTQPDRIRDVHFLRPIMRVEVGPGRGRGLTVFMVHLVSSVNAQYELAYLLSVVDKFVSSGPVFIVGDMNINIRPPATPPALPGDWQYVSTGEQTQMSGGELDWGLLRNDGTFTIHTAEVVSPFHSPWNLSDHSVIRYDLR